MRGRMYWKCSLSNCRVVKLLRVQQLGTLHVLALLPLFLTASLGNHSKTARIYSRYERNIYKISSYIAALKLLLRHQIGPSICKQTRDSSICTRSQPKRRSDPSQSISTSRSHTIAHP